MRQNWKDTIRLHWKMNCSMSSTLTAIAVRNFRIILVYSPLRDRISGTNGDVFLVKIGLIRFVFLTFNFFRTVSCFFVHSQLRVWPIPFVSSPYFKPGRSLSTLLVPNRPMDKVGALLCCYGAVCIYCDHVDYACRKRWRKATKDLGTILTVIRYVFVHMFQWSYQSINQSINQSMD